MSRYVVLLEDDPQQRLWIAGALKEAFPALEVRELISERAFRDEYPNTGASMPAAFILDRRVRWDVTRRDWLTPPGDVREGKPEEAGLRCRERLLKDPATSRVPIIIYTAAGDLPDYADMDPDTFFFLSKDSDLSVLIGRIGKCLRATERKARR